MWTRCGGELCPVRVDEKESAFSNRNSHSYLCLHAIMTDIGLVRTRAGLAQRCSAPRGGALFVEAHSACELVDLSARDLLELAARCVLGRQVAAQHAELVLQPEQVRVRSGLGLGFGLGLGSGLGLGLVRDRVRVRIGVRIRDGVRVRVRVGLQPEQRRAVARRLAEVISGANRGAARVVARSAVGAYATTARRSGCTAVCTQHLRRVRGRGRGRGRGRVRLASSTERGNSAAGMIMIWRWWMLLVSSCTWLGLELWLWLGLGLGLELGLGLD